MGKNETLAKLARAAPEIRRRFAVKDLAIFGSVARDEAKADSDLDVLVTFEGSADFDRFMDLRFYLEDMFDAAVDLVTPNALRREWKSRIQREAIHVP
jgi:uncharacterized protein